MLLAKNKKNIAALSRLDAHFDGQLIGTVFSTESTTLEDFYLNGGKWRQKLIYRTENHE